MTPLLRRVTWLSVAASLVAFFLLPWAMVDFREPVLEKQFSASARKSLSKAFNVRSRRTPRQAGAKGLSTIPTRISGYQIPLLANRRNAKIAMSLVELFTKQRQRVGPLSWAVYLVPGLAILCGWVLTRGRRRELALAVAVVCGASAAGGAWTLLTTNTRKEFAIAIGPGVWLSLAAYAALAFVAVAVLRRSMARAIMPSVAKTP